MNEEKQPTTENADRPPIDERNNLDKPAWNPTTLLLLAIPFTIIWLAVMTYLNGRRLRVPVNGWAVTGLAVGEIIVDYFVEEIIWSSIISSFLVLAGFLLVFWVSYLDPQQAVFDKQHQDQHKASWTVPAICGAPLALFTLLCLAMYFAGPTPREVCQAFSDTDDTASMRQHVTANMLPIVEQFERLEELESQVDDLDTEDSGFNFELTYEGQSDEYGGYVVGHNLFIESEKGSGLLINGFFVLVDYGEGWKIDRWYKEAEDGVVLQEGPVSMLEDWTRLANLAESAVNTATRRVSQSDLATADDPTEAPAFSISRPNFIKWARYKFGTLGGIIAVVIVILGARSAGRSSR